jgi:proteasome lid subunit RPN8/RPN11
VSQKAKIATAQPALIVDGEVVRQIRQHARSSPSAEICGVLIGQDRPGRIEIQASIAGANADEAGAHVTFTQDTWEHIYQVKDKEYPNHRIVGWYHSHPGFGVFLSDHDTFIHKNFFASPGQVAWVFDPHSDEEGCFGWVSGKIERLSQVTVSDQRGGEHVQESGRPEPSASARANPAPIEFEPQVHRLPASANDDPSPESSRSDDPLLRLTTNIFAALTLLLLGFLACWYFFPRTQLVPVPVDPMTGRPLPGYGFELPQQGSGQNASPQSPNQANGAAAQPQPNSSASSAPNPSGSKDKEKNVQPK